MDGFLGYNQIKMYLEDEKHTSFRTPLGVYCYTVMPFGLKNAGATYQCTMNKIFHEHIRKTVECYIDDITVKSCNKGYHLVNLKRVPDIMQTLQLKMNPIKSFLGVASGILWICYYIQRNSPGSREDPHRPRNATPGKSQGTQGSTGTICIYPNIYIESFRMLPTLHQVNEEGSLIHLGQRLPRSIRRVQGVSQTPTCSGSSSIRKMFLAICLSDGSFLGSFISLEQ